LINLSETSINGDIELSDGMEFYNLSQQNMHYFLKVSDYIVIGEF